MGATSSIVTGTLNLRRKGLSYEILYVTLSRLSLFGSAHLACPDLNVSWAIYFLMRSLCLCVCLCLYFLQRATHGNSGWQGSVKSEGANSMSQPVVGAAAADEGYGLAGRYQMHWQLAQVAARCKTSSFFSGYIPFVVHPCLTYTRCPHTNKILQSFHLCTSKAFQLHFRFYPWRPCLCYGIASETGIEVTIQARESRGWRKSAGIFYAIHTNTSNKASCILHFRL
jgi:hypothetical protein